MADLAQVGDRLFGRAARLIVAQWVMLHDDPLFFQTEAVQGTVLPQSNVGTELARLTELGMVSRLPRDRGTRRQYYLPQDHPLWAVVKAAVGAVRDMSDTEEASAPA